MHRAFTEARDRLGPSSIPCYDRRLRLLSRYFLVVLACLVALTSRGLAAADEDGFARGNRLYAAGKFAEAATAYEDQAHRGDDSANLFYNLGDAYQRMSKRGRAMLNYQRALVLEPTHAEAAANLAFIGGTRLTGIPGGGNFSNVDVLSWLAAAAFWLVMIGLLALTMRSGKQRIVAVGAMICLVGGMFAFGFMKLGTHSLPIALVVADSAPALYSPADNSKAVATLPAGAEVRVLSAQGAWIYALLGDGTRAWISSGKIERLMPGR